MDAPVPIVFINLASDADRRELMEAELRRASLVGTRFDATRWTQLPLHEQASLYSENLNARGYHQPLVAGEKGCYASHLAAWRQLLCGTDDARVVLEDDVCLGQQLPAVLSAIRDLQMPWDMIKLIGRDHREKIRSRRPLCAGVTLVEYTRVPSSTAGYVISRRGAQKLLASRQPFGRPIDVDLRFWWENDLTVLGVIPSVISLAETSHASSIGTKSSGASWRGVWRKFAFKWALTWGNTRANWQRARLFE
jgi:glycosyl transferase family 25